jgi:hypothetical protein
LDLLTCFCRLKREFWRFSWKKINIGMGDHYFAQEINENYFRKLIGPL